MHSPPFGEGEQQFKSHKKATNVSSGEVRVKTDPVGDTQDLVRPGNHPRKE
jgi:hypothetical protein